MKSTKKKKQGKARPARKRPAPAKRPASAGRGRAAVDEFYADALAIEVEAAARYRLLANEMQANGNKRTAELFLKLAQLEAKHADKLKSVAAAAQLLPHARERLISQRTGRTEVPNYEFVYRRVPPYHALLMALQSEQRAQAYFEGIGAKTRHPEIKKLAVEFAREEAQHVAWLENALAKEPQPATPIDDSP